MIHLFKTFLPIAEKIYDRKATMDILHHICIRDGFMMMTDLEIYVRMPVNEKQNYTIPIKMLKKVLLTKPTTLDIKVLENRRLNISFDDTFITIPTVNIDEYPSLASS